MRSPNPYPGGEYSVRPGEWEQAWARELKLGAFPPRSTSVLHRRPWAVLLLLGGLATAGVQEKPATLVSVQKGTIPVILTAPHGGGEAIPGVPERKTGVKVRDLGTREVAEATAKELEEKLGGKPYLVVALFHRKYADANRKEEEALEDDGAKAPYRAYHAAVREAVDEIRKKWPKGALLVDVHGQGAEADTVFRGTQNGKTVEKLLQRFQTAALTGPRSVFGGLEARGFKVVPPGNAPADQKEDGRFNGGFTVQTYGSHAAEGIDAIQIELGSDLRQKRRTETAKGLAESIAAFVGEYAKE